MKYIFLIFLLCTSSFLLAQEVSEDGRGTAYHIMPSGEMRKQICSQLQNPFSRENLNVVYSEIKSKFPSADDLFYKGSFNVNRQMALEVKNNCNDGHSTVQLFNHDNCLKSCDSEFNKLSPSTLKSMVNGKSAAVEMCKKSCDAVTISYNSAVRSLRPIYEKMMALKAERPKCYSTLEIMDSNNYKSFQLINDDIVPMVNSKQSAAVSK